MKLPDEMVKRAWSQLVLVGAVTEAHVRAALEAALSEGGMMAHFNERTAVPDSDSEGALWSFIEPGRYLVIPLDSIVPDYHLEEPDEITDEEAEARFEMRLQEGDH